MYKFHFGCNPMTMGVVSLRPDSLRGGLSLWGADAEPDGPLDSSRQVLEV